MAQEIFAHRAERRNMHVRINLQGLEALQSFVNKFMINVLFFDHTNSDSDNDVDISGSMGNIIFHAGLDGGDWEELGEWAPKNNITLIEGAVELAGRTD